MEVQIHHEPIQESDSVRARGRDCFRECVKAEEAREDQHGRAGLGRDLGPGLVEQRQRLRLERGGLLAVVVRSGWIRVAQVQGGQCQDLIHDIRDGQRSRHHDLQLGSVRGVVLVKAWGCVEDEVTEQLHMTRVNGRVQDAMLCRG